MPFAAVAPIIGAGIGAGGSAASAAGGKKAQKKLAQQQMQLQQSQFGVAKQQLGMGNQAFQPASNYWQSLLKGGQAAVQATGPYASLIGQAAQGARNAIATQTPRGGEQNLAMAQNYNQTSNDISRLYAGMQPMAAQGLGNLAGLAYGSAGQFNPNANIGAATGGNIFQQQAGMEGAGGFGSLLYNSINKLRNRGGGGIGASSG